MSDPELADIDTDSLLIDDVDCVAAFGKAEA